MLNSIAERRVKLDDKYKLFLDVPEDEYMVTYNNEISVSNAQDILTQFLEYHQDDGRIENIKINHDKNIGIIKIEADMLYTDNDHTSQKSFGTYYRH